jgi:hypothetical protein
MKVISFIFVFIAFSFLSFAQVGLGDWREHLPYLKAKKVIASDDNIFCLTESGVFSYSLIDNEVKAFSKTKGLSESAISSIGWSDKRESLIIGYESGNLDIINEGEIVNLVDIKNAASIQSKRINGIYAYEEFAYLATDFGIVLVNLKKKEISDTYFIGNNGDKIKVNQIQIASNDIWAATELGLFKADINSINLADFNSWVQIQEIPNYEQNCKFISVIENKVYALRSKNNTNDELLVFESGSWTVSSLILGHVNSMKNVQDELWLVEDEKIRKLNLSGNELPAVVIDDAKKIKDALGVDSRLFIADYRKSLLESSGGAVTSVKPDGPLSANITELLSTGSSTWSSSGAYDEFYNGIGTKGELNQFKEQEWVNYTSSNIPELNNVFDIRKLAANKLDSDILYAGSWGDGVLVLNNGELKNVWNETNSPQGSFGIGDMESDTQGNLWILDANSNNPVKVLSREGEWTTLSYSSLKNRRDLTKIICLSNGDKWVMRSSDSPLYAFNENGTIENEDDDVALAFSVRDESNSVLTSNVYDIVEDKSGSVWLGGNNGIVVYTDPGTIFRTGDFYAQRPIITIDGSTQYLLSSEKVLCIAVDGANQKWIGTENSGVFLVSENGDKQIEHFTSENSPLPSNQIKKISVNPGTGEVFFLTDGGLISYKGKVTEGTDSYKDLYVYPNPVRENYRGDIVVSGLIENSTVKITDVSGNLVWEGESTGGQFIWDGRNFNGSRLHTGVYLIFCSNSDGSKSEVIKLLFIN